MVKVLKSVPSGWRAPGNVSVRRTGLGWVGLPPQLERSPDSNSADPARTGRLMNERNMEGPFLRGAGARKVPAYPFPGRAATTEGPFIEMSPRSSPRQRVSHVDAAGP